MQRFAARGAKPELHFPESFSQRPQVSGHRRVLPKVWKAWGKQSLPIIGRPVSCGQCPKSSAYRWIQDCLAVSCSMSYSSAKQPAVVAKATPSPASCPIRCRGHSPAEASLGSRVLLPRLQKAASRNPPVSVHLAIHARPEGSWPPNPLSRPSFSRPPMTVCGPMPPIYPLFYYAVSSRISLTEPWLNPEGI